ncbi:MAG: DUF3303 family protein [candidate division NC10 bacterium]|nr:DUF3303 family protein [candidate division NC10 bacterium]
MEVKELGHIVLYVRDLERARDAAIARFKKGGGMPPAGVKLLGRWHAADLSSGVAISEAPRCALLLRSHPSRVAAP